MKRNYFCIISGCYWLGKQNGKRLKSYAVKITFLKRTNILTSVSIQTMFKACSLLRTTFSSFHVEYKDCTHMRPAICIIRHAELWFKIELSCCKKIYQLLELWSPVYLDMYMFTDLLFSYLCHIIPFSTVLF